MGRPIGGDYVTGQPGSYEVQPTVIHPDRCVCARCEARGAIERAGGPFLQRIRRKSPYPESRPLSAAFALDLKNRMESDLRDAMTAKRPAGVIPLSDLCELYFAVNPRKVADATIARDRINARNVCRLIVGMPPDEIDEPVAVRYRIAREKESVAPRTILNELSFLRMVLDFGLKWQSETGIRALRLLKIPDVGDWTEEGVALSQGEVGALLEVADERTRQILVTAVTTMLRRHPLLELRTGWLDLSKKWLSVPREWQKKGKAKRRYPLEIPLSGWAAHELSAAIGDRSGLVWPSIATGEALTTPWRFLHPLAVTAKTREFSLHDLRTTGATWLREAGVDELGVALLLGHRSTFDPATETFHAKSSNVTRGYTKMFEPTLRGAVAVFDEIRKKISRETSGLRLA